MTGPLCQFRPVTTQASYETEQETSQRRPRDAGARSPNNATWQRAGTCPDIGATPAMESETKKRAFGCLPNVALVSLLSGCNAERSRFISPFFVLPPYVVYIVGSKSITCEEQHIVMRLKRHALDQSGREPPHSLVHERCG